MPTTITEIKLDRKSLKNVDSIVNAEKIINKGIRLALFEMGSENIKYVRKLYRQPKSGKLYKKPDGKTPHRASAPGEPPAIWSGDLDKNMKYVVRGNRQMEFGDKPIYGLPLERGSQRMKPRPHLIKTVMDRRRSNDRILHEMINMEIKKNAR